MEIRQPALTVFHSLGEALKAGYMHDENIRGLMRVKTMTKTGWKYGLVVVSRPWEHEL